MSFLILLAGLILLIASGELLVKGAVSAALRFRISPLVIGLTVVSLGTSAPELLVSVQAAVKGHADIAIGNVVGSNIANLGLVLGITALIYPIAIARDSIRIDWPVMMAASILFLILIWDGKLGLVEGSVFILMLVLFIVLMIRRSRKLHLENAATSEVSAKSWPIAWAVISVVAGCVGLVFGAKWFLQGAETIARAFGVSDHLIGVTLVAFGTSLPELVTSCVAALRKQADLSVGNLIGSNLFNILGILGVTSVVKTIEVNERIFQSDVWWMLGVSFIIFPMMVFGKRLGRVQGGLLFLIYFLYIYLVLSAEKA